MTDPTIPELVARLRELHAKLQALQVGTPEFTAARQLFRDVLQLSAPAILDALDHVGDANKMVRGIPMTDDGLEWIERLDGSLDLFRAGSGANLATVYTNGTWFTWGANGTGGENGKAPDVETAKARAIKALVRQPRSPDGGVVELPEHLETELELLRTQRALSDTERDYLRASAEADHLFERAVAAESRSTWLPIEERGELEAGEYLVRMKRGVLEEHTTIARWSGAEWQVRIVDAERYYYRAEHITHVHRMGPIRGPEETT